MVKKRTRKSEGFSELTSWNYVLFKQFPKMFVNRVLRPDSTLTRQQSQDKAYLLQACQSTCRFQTLPRGKHESDSIHVSWSNKFRWQIRSDSKVNMQRQCYELFATSNQSIEGTVLRKAKSKSTDAFRTQAVRKCAFPFAVTSESRCSQRWHLRRLYERPSYIRSNRMSRN